MVSADKDVMKATGRTVGSAAAALTLGLAAADSTVDTAAAGAIPSALQTKKPTLTTVAAQGRVHHH